MKKVVFIIFFNIIIFSLQAQLFNNEPQKGKLLEKAYYYLNDGYNNYHLALPYLIQYWEKDSSNSQVNFEIGKCIYHTKSNFTSAEKYFESAKKEYAESYFYLARIAHKNENFQNAELYFSKYMELKNREVSDSVVNLYRFKNHTANMLYEMNTNIKITLLGEEINSKYPDYAPILPPDESILFFTSRRENSVGGGVDAYGNYFEDIYMSVYAQDKWSKAQNMGYPLNGELHDACLSISADASSMYFYRTNPELTGGDIWYSEYENNKWKLPKRLRADFNDKRASTKTVSITPTFDSTVFYIVSNIPGGYGGTDIYQVRKFGDGSWSLPINLGPNINTPYDEDCPFLHINGKDFYFSSKGHANMGSFDIFHSIKLNDTSYTAPENMGYPINSVNGDRFFIISPDSKTAYFSTERKDGFGSSDIYKINFENLSKDYVVIRGFIKDASTKENIDAELTVTDPETGDVIGIYKPNSVTGKYVILLSSNLVLSVEISADGYEMQKQSIATKHASQEPEIEHNVLLKPIAK